MLGTSVLQWAPLVSAIIAFCAVVVAVSALGFQYWQFKKNREPVIAPAIRSFDLYLPETHLDWDTGEKLEDKFADTTIPIYNYGGTAAINIAYSYRFTNVSQIKESLINKIKDEDYKIKINSINGKIEPFEIFFQNPVLTKTIRINKIYTRRKDLISPGEKIDIQLPSYFLIIISYAICFGGINNQDFPELELSLTYNDINHKNWNVKYMIKMDSNYRWRIQSDKLRFECAFIPEYISKEKIN